MVGQISAMLGRNNEKSCAGFSLLEVLFVLGFMAILLSTVSPNLFNYYNHLKLLMTAWHLVQEINLARSEAIRRNQTVSYCMSDWTGRWGKGRSILNQNGTILHHFGPLPEIYCLSLKNSLGHNDRLNFLPLGLTNAQRGSFYLSSPEETLRIVFSLSGRAYVVPISSKK